MFKNRVPFPQKLQGKTTTSCFSHPATFGRSIKLMQIRGHLLGTVVKHLKVPTVLYPSGSGLCRSSEVAQWAHLSKISCTFFFISLFSYIGNSSGTLTELLTCRVPLHNLGILVLTIERLLRFFFFGQEERLLRLGFGKGHISRCTLYF